MKNKISLLLFCVMSALTVNAQRNVPAMLVHLKDGSTDTVYIENNLVSFYGLDNPKPGDYVTLNLDGSYVFPYDNTDINNKRYKELYKADASLTEEGEAFPCSFYTGTILSTRELDESFLTDEFLLNYKKGNGMMYLVDCKDIINNWSPIFLPYDGTTYYAYAFAINEDSNKRFLSDATVIKAYADSWYIAKTKGYEFYEREENKAIALNCNYDLLTSSCKQDMPWLPDHNIKSAIQTYLNAMKFDFSSYTKAATAKRDCTDAMLYFVDNVTTQTKEDILQAINNVSVTDNSLYNAMVQSGINSDMTDFASKDLTYSIDKENSSLVEGTGLYSAITLKQNLSPSVFGADIAADKSYTMLLPDKNAFNSIYAAAKPYYNYITGFNYMDVTQTTYSAASIKTTTAPSARKIYVDVDTYSYYATISNAIAKNIVFDNSVDANQPLLNGTAKEDDTIISAAGRQLSNVQAILAHTKKHNTTNNGTLYEIDELPFKSWETYNPALEYHTPLRTLGLRQNYTYSENTFSATDLAARDTLFDNVPDFLKKKIVSAKDGSLSYICTDSINFNSAAVKPEFDFALNNVRSTKYHIYVVTAPAQIKNPEKPLKPLYLRMDLAYNDADGSQKYERLNIPGAQTTDDIVVHNDGKLGVVELEVEFPICYEGLEAYPTLFMSHTKSFTPAANRRSYEQELRVVGIYLISEDEIQSLNK